MNKAAIFIAIFLILGFSEVARAQIALSQYFCENSVKCVSGAISRDCCKCAHPYVQRVYSVDKRILPYTYTYCADNNKITLDVGVSKNEKHRFFEFSCSATLFIALDPAKETLAAEFFYNCVDGMLYKCLDNQVFDQQCGKCVPKATSLVSNLNNCVRGCCTPTVCPLSDKFCEAKLFYTLKPTCTSCKSPFQANVITERCESTPGYYTFCAETGRFSIDTNCGNKPHNWFTPYCYGTNPVVPIDSSKKSAASRYFWDCRIGMVACADDKVFDPVTNTCTGCESGLSTGLPNCYKTCSAYSYGPSYYGQGGYNGYYGNGMGGGMGMNAEFSRTLITK